METKPDCAACPFAVNGKPRHQPVWGEVCGRSAKLPPTAKPEGVLIGEGPGEQEVTEQGVFKGSTGQQLDLALEQVGIIRKRHAVFNVMGCRPPKGMKTEDNLRAATAACRPLFMHQYERYAKLPTLAMGKWASAGANQGKPIGVMKGRGFVRGNLLVTWHPTYAFWHNPWSAGEFLNDLARYKRMLTGTLEPPPKVIIEPTLRDLHDFSFEALQFAKLLKSLDTKHRLPAFALAMASDIETKPADGQPAYEGKDPTRAAMKAISFGTPMLAVSHWWGNGAPGVESKMIQWLRDPDILIIGHNYFFFDDRVQKRYGIRATNVIDTRDLRRAVSATSRLTLRFLTSVYSDFAPWKETEDDK